MKDKNHILNKETHTLHKQVLVEDPWRWYEKDIIDVSMWILPDNKTVRIMFSSIDDTAVCCDFSEWSADSNWKWMKQWRWDTIPEIVSTECLINGISETQYAPKSDVTREQMAVIFHRFYTMLNK